jgi:competence protein ComEA
MDAQPVSPADASSPLPRSAQWALCFLLGVALTAAAARFGPVFRHAKPTEHRVAAGLDLNRADKAELMQLPQVSERRADAIIATRADRGGFESVNDLRKVKGVGPARQEQMRPYVRVEGDEQFVKPPPVSAEKPAKKDSLTATIDVNRASAEELQKLPGVGKVMASRIIVEREKSPFRSAEDLRRVPGIGPKTLEKLRPFVRFPAVSDASEKRG